MGDQELLDKNQLNLLLGLFIVEVREEAPQRSHRNYIILQKRKRQNNPNEFEYIIIDNYFQIPRVIMNHLNQCRPNQGDLQYSSYVPFTKDRSIDIMPLLNLMEITGLAA